jgi:hypothetical protein
MLINLEASGGGSLTVQLYHASSTSDDYPLLTSTPVVLNGVDLVVSWGATNSSRCEVNPLKSDDGDAPVPMSSYSMAHVTCAVLCVCLCVCARLCVCVRVCAKF